jgi:hypothetical protein
VSGGLVSSAAERNKAPILQVLQRFLPREGLVLEIASGTGQHVVHFAAALPNLTWQPTDPDAEARRSICAWIATSALGNVRRPVELDVRVQPWPVQECHALVCINMIHISPWTATTALFAGAEQTVADSGIIYLYGPYRVQGRHTAPSNEAFDRSLRAQDAAWGVRDLDEVLHVAKAHAFDLIETVSMPANNLSVVLRKRSAATAPGA